MGKRKGRRRTRRKSDFLENLQGNKSVVQMFEEGKPWSSEKRSEEEQRPPESMLFESPHTDTSFSNKLSPEIVRTTSKVQFDLDLPKTGVNATAESKNDAEEISSHKEENRRNLDPKSAKITRQKELSISVDFSDEFKEQMLASFSENQRLVYTGHRNFSSKIFPKLPRIKLDLDQPEIDAEDETENTVVESMASRSNCKENETLEISSKDSYMSNKTPTTRDLQLMKLSSSSSVIDGERPEGVGQLINQAEPIIPTRELTNKLHNEAGKTKELNASSSCTNKSIESDFTTIAVESDTIADSSNCGSSFYECSRFLKKLRLLNFRKSKQQDDNTNIPSEIRALGYKRFEDEAHSRSSFVSTSSSCLSTPSTRSPFTLNCPIHEGKPKIGEDCHVGTAKNTKNEGTSETIRFTTPRGGTPTGKRFRSLRFDEEDEENEMTKAKRPTVAKVEDVFLENREHFMKIDSDARSNSCIIQSTSSCVQLPLVSDSNCRDQTPQQAGPELESRKRDKVTDCKIEFDRQQSPASRFSKMMISRIIVRCMWSLKKLGTLLRKSFRKLRNNCFTIILPKLRNTNKNDLNGVVSILRLENEQMMSVLLEKVAGLSEEIVKVRVGNETALNKLTTEIRGVRETSEKLTEYNDSLVSELKKFQAFVNNERSKVVQAPLSLTSHSPVLRPASSSAQLPPPPPPPPPPPAPSQTPTLRSSTFQTCPSQATPNNNDKITKTPTRKSSTPIVSDRPRITVDDLLKVTLRSVKERRKNSLPDPRGPMVSLDMLRNVKLKSARRRTSEQMLKSPRTGRVAKNRQLSSSLSLSPIMKGAESSLCRILRQVDATKRGPRRIVSSGNCRDNDSRSADSTQHPLAKSKSTIA